MDGRLKRVEVVRQGKKRPFPVKEDMPDKKKERPGKKEEFLKSGEVRPLHEVPLFT